MHTSVNALRRIRLEDFLYNFDALCICHLPPELSVSSSKLWNSHLFRSRWVRNYSAGGRPKFKGAHCVLYAYNVLVCLCAISSQVGERASCRGRLCVRL